MFEFNCGNSNDGIRMIRIQFAPGVTEYKAGTPFSREGRFSNDGNAYGLLRQDIRLPVGGKMPVVTEGTVNTDELARHCGVALSEEAKAAMEGIAFVTDGDPIPSGGASSWNDLKDRPFGEDWLVPETTVEGFALMEGTLYAVQNPFSLTLSVGATYVVNWDGAEYELVCNVIEEAHLTYIGNANYTDMVSGGDIPFAFILEPESGTLFVVTESAANSHTISVKGVKTIAKKYMSPMTRLYKGGNFGGDIGYLYEDILRQIPLDFLDFRNRFLNGERFYCVVDDFMGSKNVFVNILSFHANAEDNFGTASGYFSGQSMAFNLVKEEGAI